MLDVLSIKKVGLIAQGDGVAGGTLALAPLRILPHDLDRDVLLGEMKRPRSPS